MRGAAERWIEEIRAALTLSSAGVLILVDKAVPEQLGRVVRALMRDHPDLEVVVEVEELASLADGSLVVLVPRAEAAGWLNEHRPLFARKALRVLLWCDEATSIALAQQAPDFYDWIAQRQECPPGAAEHAVWGLRRALCARAPGVVFVRSQPSDKAFEKVFHAALPGSRVVWLTPEATPYARLVEQIREARCAWVGCVSFTYDCAERFRWALAEARRRTRSVLVVPEGGDDWFWTLTDHLAELGWSIRALSKAGAKHPGRLAAVSGLESATIFGLLELLSRDYEEADLLRAMLGSTDAGAGLAERMLSSNVADGALQGQTMFSPVQRYLGKLVGLHRKTRRPPTRKADGWVVMYDQPGLPLFRGWAHRIEYILCSKPRTAETWAELASLALEHGSHDAAAAWAGRSLAMRETAEMLRIYGVARGELGLFNSDHGSAIGPSLIADALRALDRVTGAPDAATRPEDAFAMHALRADLLTRAGFAGETRDALAAALGLIETPAIRTRDLLRLVNVLGRHGRFTRAEEVARMAMGKARTDEERRESLLLLGRCALHQGRPKEALALSEKALAGLPQAFEWHAEQRLDAEWLHVEALSALDLGGQALAFADKAVHAAAPWFHPGMEVLPAQATRRLPLLARALRHAGRLQDAEVLYRKLLGMPVTLDARPVGAGLASQHVLQAFAAAPDVASPMPPETRSLLTRELALALRSQGRYPEAEELSPGISRNKEP